MSIDESDVPQAHEGILLGGLDGTNPLAFIAALGAFRLLAVDNTCATMSWELCNATWRPLLCGTGLLLEQLGGELHSRIGELDMSVWSLDKKLPFAAARFRQKACDATRDASDSRRGILLTRSPHWVLSHALMTKGISEILHSAWSVLGTRPVKACLLMENESWNRRRLVRSNRQSQTHGDIKINSARYDGTQQKIAATPFNGVTQATTVRFRVRGANCLALLGITMFPTIPTKGQPETTAFGLKAPKQSSFSWPIWKYPVSFDVATSLVRMPVLQREEPPEAELQCRGVAAVYRCDRVMTSTYYANFTPARRVA